MALSCEGCRLAGIFKSGTTIRRADGSISAVFVEGNGNFLLRECIRVEDNAPFEVEVAVPSEADCIYPNRRIPIEAVTADSLTS